MHDITNSPAYRKAFIAYLRRGISPYVSIKAGMGEVHVLDKYIWRTQGDDKVRPDHAACEGEVFSWDEPPSIGHPGQDYNCRCMAEPYLEDIDPSDFQEIDFETVTYAPNDEGPRWDSIRMAEHYETAHGKAVTLQEIGHMQEIIRHVQNYIPEDGVRKVTISRQVLDAYADKIRISGPGRFTGSHHDYYDFGLVEWAHGHSGLATQATGMVSALGPFLVFNLNIEYRFADIFQDPLDLARFGISIETGTPYHITGSWQARIGAVIYRDRNTSRYVTIIPKP